MRSKVGPETPKILEASRIVVFRLSLGEEGKEVLRQPCQGAVFGLSTNCKIGEVRSACRQTVFLIRGVRESADSAIMALL
jgi:hypothetical protein